MAQERPSFSVGIDFLRASADWKTDVHVCPNGSNDHNIQPLGLTYSNMVRELQEPTGDLNILDTVKVDASQTAIKPSENHSANEKNVGRISNDAEQMQFDEEHNDHDMGTEKQNAMMSYDKLLAEEYQEAIEDENSKRGRRNEKPLNLDVELMDLCQIVPYESQLYSKGLPLPINKDSDEEMNNAVLVNTYIKTLRVLIKLCETKSSSKLVLISDTSSTSSARTVPSSATSSGASLSTASSLSCTTNPTASIKTGNLSMDFQYLDDLISQGNKAPLQAPTTSNGETLPMATSTPSPQLNLGGIGLFNSSTPSLGKRKRSYSNLQSDQPAQQNQEEVHPNHHELRIVTPCGTSIKLEKGKVLLSQNRRTEIDMTSSEWNLYIPPTGTNTTTDYTNLNPSEVLQQTNTTGGLYMEFSTSTKVSLQYVDGVFTKPSPDSTNEIYGIKAVGHNISEVTDVRDPTIPDEYIGEARKNIQFMLDAHKQNFYGWMKCEESLLHIWCSFVHAFQFVDALNETLASLHASKSRFSRDPRPQIEGLPGVSTQMVWVILPVPLLQMLGLRLFAWADMTVFILDHRHDVMLIGKTSVAGKGKVEGKPKKVDRNDWDLAKKGPVFNGVSKYLMKKK